MFQLDTSQSTCFSSAYVSLIGGRYSLHVVFASTLCQMITIMDVAGEDIEAFKLSDQKGQYFAKHLTGYEYFKTPLHI